MNRYPTMRCSGRMRRSLLLACSLVGALFAVAAPRPLPAAADNDMTPWRTPTVPPRCSATQLSSGQVAGCLLFGSGYDPDTVGWPSPPFPSGGSGWVWNGSNFNGSPALADWEALMIKYPQAIGGLKSNTLTMMADGWPLFEGFLKEINSGGYVLREGTGYGFRCTSSSGSRNCSGLTRSSLSNHAWGLAVDFNAAANPQRTYSGINGATACATPMVTDIPRWVVQTAEKWGLYWGGYGWSSGCISPTQVKSSASRDPHHFEFRGSPQQAEAIMLANGARPPSAQCLDVASAAGVISSQCFSKYAPIPGDTRLVVTTTPPGGATAALVNITATETPAAGYLTAESCAAVNGPRTSSNVNARVNGTVANLAVVGLDSAGKFCVYQQLPGHVVVDVQGYFAPASGGSAELQFFDVPDDRLVDTRIDSWCLDGGACGRTGPVPGGSEVAVDVASAPSAVLANLTVTEAGGPGYVTAGRCSILQPGPQTTSNVNYVTGDTRANLAVVGVDSGSPSRMCLYSSGRSHLVADAVGVLAAPGSGGLDYQALPPARLVDTRECRTIDTGGEVCGVAVANNSILRVQGPVGASSALVNIVATDSVSSGYLTAGLCADLLPGPQSTSTVNVTRGSTVSNVAIVPLAADGSFCVYSQWRTHVVVDVQGTFSPAAGLRLTVSAPVRVLDTRPNQPG
jgi:hypothetical protein